MFSRYGNTKLTILIKNKLAFEFLKIRHRCLNLINITIATRKYGVPNVASIDETLDKLLEGKISMSRFGDGEYKVIKGRGNAFQKHSKALSKRLREIIKMNGKYDDYIVCIPNIPRGYNLLIDEARNFWFSFMRDYGYKWYKLLNFDSMYYNAHVTRLYYDWKSKDNCRKWFEKIKKVWENQDIVIVEGEKSRLGVGNDLFDGTKSIIRILAPSNNAFDYYDEILNAVKKQPKDKLVLIALGQTATVLAFDLYREGYWAIDIGHIDIEYEWFLKNTKEKIAIKGKYVKEVQNLDEVEVLEDKVYNGQIIQKIG